MNDKINKLVEVSKGLDSAVKNAIERWRNTPEQQLRFRPASDAWSAKEIIGHLIDSASNNHQRFVRLQLTQRLSFPDYGQDNIHWVRIQNYQEREWIELLDLWRAFNIQLAHVMRTVDPSCLLNTWPIDPDTRITLYDMMVDYLRHLEDHLDQISETLNAS